MSFQNDKWDCQKGSSAMLLLYTFLITKRTICSSNLYKIVNSLILCNMIITINQLIVTKINQFNYYYITKRNSISELKERIMKSDECDNL